LAAQTLDVPIARAINAPQMLVLIFALIFSRPFLA